MLEDIKLTRIKLNNFKNVHNGEVSFVQKHKISNVTGFYGQNGSGKTAVVEAIELFKLLVAGKELDHEVINLIEHGEKSLIVELEFEFLVNPEKQIELEKKEGNRRYKCIYYFEIGKIPLNNKHDQENLINEIKQERHAFKPIVIKEAVYIKNESLDKRIRKPIEYNQELKSFMTVKPQVNVLNDIETRTNFLLSYKLANSKSSSFIFLEETIDTFRTLAQQEKESESTLKELYLSIYWFTVIGRRIITITNEKNGYVFSNVALPLNLFVEDKNQNIVIDFEILLPIKNTRLISELTLNVGKCLLKAINEILSLIIPDLTVNIKVVGEELDEEGEKRFRIALVSNRNNIEFPFYTESDGIKKVVYILAGIIQIFNNKNNILVVDEFDSSIFEFLLGELLELIAMNAKGQLFFTSHNLRALEVLDYTSIVFTTTNINQRYLKPKNIKESNNLRHAYIRGIQINNFEEQLYKSANLSKVKLALLKSKKEMEQLNRTINSWNEKHNS